jgi:hypothetical protein
MLMVTDSAFTDLEDAGALSGRLFGADGFVDESLCPKAAALHSKPVRIRRTIRSKTPLRLLTESTVANAT